MRISIFGSGYVGLVQAAVFSEVGHQITCMDIDPARMEGGIAERADHRAKHPAPKAVIMED